MNFLNDPYEAAQEAPLSVEMNVVTAFRRYHRVRKIRRIAVASVGTAAAVAVVAAFLLPPEIAFDRPAPVAMHSAPPAIAFVKSVLVKQPVRVHRPARKPPVDLLASAQFVPLAFGDASLMSESATVVRIELPRSALRLAGLAVAQENANDRVQADVVLGPDGLAHAVRFVSY